MDRAPGPSGPPFDAQAWSDYLTERLENPFVVTFGRARHQVVRSRGHWGGPHGKPIELRLSSFFERAEPPVREALATWLRHGKRARAASRLLDAFIAEQLAHLPPKPRPAAASRLDGEAHHLGPLLRGLIDGPEAEFVALDFAPRGLPAVSWGRRQKSRARRSLQLGSYTETSHAVRIHPVLDQSGVPAFFLRYVLFHELLHAVRSIAAEVGSRDHARRLHHDASFRAREAAYPDFDAALAWQKKHISALLRSARSGRALRSGLLSLGAKRGRA